ncbi:hypothetical protein SAMN02927921_01997 [Sinomicrobium oceani]|uniref:Uncharacterized protein n=1 Tax=Sinomicrobium oceani TaxID=1150368 RepID=A0A1K1PRZ9_9FLAO|nr:hypothetical protein [Sinomicrobium oceani]SFW50432.1 hypothetical protein SAMN02927921_01997 [Sinomicrobium oceani]
MEFLVLLKQLDGKLTVNEEKIFDQWYNSSEFNRSYYQRFRDNYLGSDNM